MKLPANISALASRGKILLNKRSPELWLIGGIVMIVGGTVAACAASRKLDHIVEDHEDIVEEINVTKDRDLEEVDEKIEEVEEYDKRVAEINSKSHKELMHAKVSTGIAIARSYAPAVILIAGGIGMVINGHRILCKRNAILLAAYSTLDDTFKKYRSRVADRYGKDVEDDIYTGREWKEVTHVNVDGDGKKVKIKDKVPVVGDSLSPYARFFDETSTEWQRSPDYNHIFLKCQQSSANDKLRANGFLFLNEVYKMLGMTQTPTGAICGWIMPDENDPLAEGDKYVDFGFEQNLAFMTGEEKSILLDFNCQGIIYDKI